MNAIPNEDREAYVYIRAQCFCLLDWVITTHTFTVEGETEPVADPYMEIYTDPFVDIWEALYYHADFLQEYHPDIPGVDIRTQLTLCFQKDKGLLDILAEMDSHDHISWKLGGTYVISPKLNDDFTSEFPIFSFCVLGMDLISPLETYKDFMECARTAADDMYFADDPNLLQQVTDEYELQHQEISEDEFAFVDDNMDSDYTLSRGKSRAKGSRRRSYSQETERPKKKQKKVKTVAAAAAA